MEAQQMDQNQDLGNRSSSNYLCGQGSTRWTPTFDQIRILKELYYTNGIRSPTADQIQRIAARLRQYGKIEGKNVFFWFQNHKARERQKKRFNRSAPPLHAAAPPPSTAANNHLPPPFPDHHYNPTTAMHFQEPNNVYHHQQHKLYTTHHISPAGVGSSSSTQGVMAAVGCAYGSVAMEKSFRECSISPGGSRAARVTGQHNLGSWVDVDFFDKLKQSGPFDHDQETLEEEERESAQIETLPLFPIKVGSAGGTATTHHDFFNIKAPDNHAGGYYTGGNWYRSNGSASLELSLNSSFGYYH